MTDNIENSIIEDDIHYCEKHPDRDTELRCNRCERYMCIECAVRTPVGYTCNECVRGHEDRFYAGTQVDYIVVAVVSLICGTIGGYGVGLFGGFWYITAIAASAVGGMIAQLALTLTGRRRGRVSGYVCAGGVLAGGIIAGVLSPTNDIAMLLYLALATSSAYASFKVSI
jgi:hypothetical protein